MAGLETMKQEEQLRRQIDQILARVQRRAKNMSDELREHFESLTGGLEPEKLLQEVRKEKTEAARGRLLDCAEALQLLEASQSVLNVSVFEEDGRFKAMGGFAKINKVFAGQLENIVRELNEYLYDDGGSAA